MGSDTIIVIYSKDKLLLKKLYYQICNDCNTGKFPLSRPNHGNEINIRPNNPLDGIQVIFSDSPYLWIQKKFLEIEPTNASETNTTNTSEITKKTSPDWFLEISTGHRYNHSGEYAYSEVCDYLEDVDTFDTSSMRTDCFSEAECVDSNYKTVTDWISRY